jgi:hypothetical protein
MLKITLIFPISFEARGTILLTVVIYDNCTDMTNIFNAVQNDKDMRLTGGKSCFRWIFFH